MTPDLMILVYVALGSAFSAVITGFFTYMGLKKKTMTSWLDSLLEANEDFRNEVRGDLDRTRAEAENLRVNLLDIEEKYRRSIEQIADLQKIIIDYQQEITELKTTIINYQNEIALLKAVIDDYKVEVEKLREEIKKLNTKK